MSQAQIDQLSDTEKAQAIVDYVATNATYTTDTGEHWSTVDEFATGGLKGDCEDIANFTASLMMGAGLTSDQVQLGITAGTDGGPAHVSLLLNIDGTGPKVCDISTMTQSRDDIDTTNDTSTNLKTLAVADKQTYEVIYSADGVKQTDGMSYTFGVESGDEQTSGTTEADALTMVANAEGVGTLPDGTAAGTGVVSTETADGWTVTTTIKHADGTFTTTVAKYDTNKVQTSNETKEFNTSGVLQKTVTTPYSEGIAGDSTTVYTSGQTKTDYNWEVKDSEGNIKLYNSLLEASEAIKKDYLKPYVFKDYLSPVGNMNASAAQALNGMTNALMAMADLMSTNSGQLGDAGQLFMVQTIMQQMKDAVAAITACAKLVNDTVSATKADVKLGLRG